MYLIGFEREDVDSIPVEVNGPSQCRCRRSSTGLVATTPGQFSVFDIVALFRSFESKATSFGKLWRQNTGLKLLILMLVHMNAKDPIAS
jgi:hypothetical protein